MPRRFILILFLLFLLIFLGIKIFPKFKGGEVLDMGYEIEKPKVIKKEKKEVYIPPVLDLKLLQGDLSEKSLSIGRNIFRYGAPKKTETGNERARDMGRNVPKVPPKVPSEPLATQEVPQTPRVEATPKREPPYFNYKYLGFFGPQDKKLAVFSDGKEIIDVFEGETIMDKFIVKKIGFESVTIGFVGFPEDITQKIEVGP
ncbi:MAG: hypothetical protein WHV67_00405 [Thermoanaerobaculia bacterium]